MKKWREFLKAIAWRSYLKPMAFRHSRVHSSKNYFTCASSFGHIVVFSQAVWIKPKYLYRRKFRNKGKRILRFGRKMSIILHRSYFRFLAQNPVQTFLLGVEKPKEGCVFFSLAVLM